MGIYLGQSPHHAKSVALILNLLSGCVSPQFHCVVDSNFETKKPQLSEAPLPKSSWQEKCYFRHSTAQAGEPEGAVPGTSSQGYEPDPGATFHRANCGSTPVEHGGPSSLNNCGHLTRDIMIYAVGDNLDTQDPQQQEYRRSTWRRQPPEFWT